MQAEEKRSVMVCQNTSCRDRGSREVLEAFQAAELPEDVEAIACDCQGQCNMGPTVRVVPEEIWYCRIDVADIPRIVEEHLKNGQPVEEKLHPRIHLRYYL
ncbi:MAG: (2Fe-2S) ferredoxin domain-containing protein [Cyanobacteriota bacterium]|nr:(2Fe-2S) ferredoxin domain-containing protein [Cyanobacteriota bacterium]